MSESIVQKVEAEAKQIESTIKAYCLKCKKQIQVKNPATVETANKRMRVSGECPDCNKQVSQFQKSEKPQAAAAVADQAADVAKNTVAKSQ